MSKMSFIVEFEDGKEPAIGFATDILGGKLLSFAFSDIRPVWHPAKVEPPYMQPLLVLLDNGTHRIDIFDESLGWRGANIYTYVTHWMEITDEQPEDDE